MYNSPGFVRVTNPVEHVRHPPAWDPFTILPVLCSFGGIFIIKSRLTVRLW